MKKSIFFLIILSLFIVPLYALDEAVQDEAVPIEKINVITSIEIIGLKRTKLHIAKYPLEKYLGQDREAFDEKDVFATVKNMSVLEPVSAELIDADNELILRVTVEEKWSVFPFPLIFAGSGETSFGLFLFDANAFGLRNTAVLGGAYGSNGWSAIAMYSHTSNRQGVPGWTGVFMFNHQEKENVDRDEQVHRVYSADRFLVSSGLNYSFTDYFIGSAGIYFSSISLKDNDNIFNPPDSGAMIVGISPRLSLRQSSWDGYFLSGQSISLDYSYNFAIYGSSYHQVDLRGVYEKSLIPGFRLNIRSGGSWKSTEDPLFEDGPQKAQVSILPRKYSALHYAGLSAGLEKYLYKNRWGTLSVQSAYQCVLSYRLDSEFEFDHGPSSGVVFYLSRVALPAIGTGLAYNVVSGLFQFSFSMGMSF